MINTNKKHDNSLIAAVSGAQGTSAINMVRVSGPGCLALGRKFLRHLKNLSQPLKLDARKLSYGAFVDPKTSAIIDDVMGVFFKGPASYTGEDMLEIQCHGSPFVVQKILKSFFDEGCRQAKPGEFTKRAFLNGKIDLLQAEAIDELIKAQSSSQWKAARQLASGKLGQYILELRESLIAAMALLEAQIDFPDEGETASLRIKDVDLAVDRLLEALRKLAQSYECGRVATQGLQVVIAGLPNAGKSSLLNRLLDRPRALVSDIAGTTRDFIEEGCLVFGRYIRLIDTAGLHDSQDFVESLGIKQAHSRLKQADLILFLAALDSEAKQSNELLAGIENAYPEKKIFFLRTKSDLKKMEPLSPGDRNWISISTQQDTGIDELKSQIAAFVDQFTGELSEDVFLTSARQLMAIEKAAAALANFKREREDTHVGEECLALNLLEASRQMQSVIGHIYSDDVLEKIFSSFCIGK